MSCEINLNKKLSRRDFNKLVVGTAAAALMQPKHGQAKESSLIKSPEKNSNKILADIFGIHVLGGGDYKDLTLLDAGRLQAKSLLVIDTNTEMLTRLYDENDGLKLPIVTRLYTPDNLCSDQYLSRIEDTVKRTAEYMHYPLIEPFNEPNLYTPEISPEQHANDFLEAAKLIQECSGIPMLTPLATHTQDDDLSWQREFLDALINHEDFTPEMMTLPDGTPRLAVSYHSYITKIGEDPIPHLQKQNDIVRQSFGQLLPAYITEAGISMDATEEMSEYEEAEETVRFLSTPIPLDLSNVEGIYWWLLADDAQRRNPKPEHIRDEVWNDQALRYGRESIYDVSPTYLAIEEFMTKRNEFQKRKSQRFYRGMTE